jgi:MFS superfamily sulfate permease-like transporter
MPLLARYAPGLAALLHYKLADAPADLRAGLAVTAVALPVGIAYAELAGFRPEVGLYSSILPLVAYPIFGTSRQSMEKVIGALKRNSRTSGGPLAPSFPR